MSIEVRVPEEIADYKEKIIGSLSIRQLICGGIALASSVAAYFLFKPLSPELATYVAMFVAIPSFCMGWFKSKDGYQFEEWLKIKIYAVLSTSKRKYEIDYDANILPIEVEEYRQEIQYYYEQKRKAELAEKNQKRGVNIVGNKKAPKQKKRNAVCPASEHFLVEVTEKSIKTKRKAAGAAVKKAARINRKEKLKKNKAA